MGVILVKLYCDLSKKCVLYCGPLPILPTTAYVSRALTTAYQLHYMYDHNMITIVLLVAVQYGQCRAIGSRKITFTRCFILSVLKFAHQHLYIRDYFFNMSLTHVSSFENGRNKRSSVDRLSGKGVY